MKGLSLQSAGRRFFKRLVFSLGQALIFGGLVGALVYFRAPGGLEEGPPSLLRAAREVVERWELATYDSRARSLGGMQEPSDEVVVVPIDEETLTAGRQGDDAALATQPWPRQVVGSVVAELLEEGASRVLLDGVFADLSPHACLARPRGPALPGSPLGEVGDDALFRQKLDATPRASVLAFSWEREVTPPPPAPLRPYLLFVASAPSRQASFGVVQQILGERHPAYVRPAGGSSVEVWAAVADEEQGRGLASRWRLGGTPRLRELSAADRPFHVGPLELFLSLAELQVEGLDARGLPSYRALTHPVPALLSEGSAYGSVTVVRDLDGLVRRVQHLAAFEDEDGKLHVLPSLALAAALADIRSERLSYEGGYLKAQGVAGAFALPMTPEGQSLLSWGTDESDLPVRGSLKRAIPAWRVLANWKNRSQDIPPRHDNALSGRLVVFTGVADAGGDAEASLRTPIGGVARGALFGQALVDVLASKGIRRASAELDGLLTFGMAFLGAFLALSFSASLRSRTGLAVYLMSIGVTALGYYGFAHQAFVERGLWIAVFGPLFALFTSFVATTAYAIKDEWQVRAFITSVLGRYVPPDVARQVKRNVGLVRPERRRLTVLFAELEGSTALAESLAPERLAELLGDYLSLMTETLQDQQGHLDKYMGDSLLAFWGAPARTSRHALLACETALQMHARFSKLGALWEKEFGKRPVLRIGLNTGEVVVGNMGSALKANYTVMGKAVNFAARLEAENARYGTAVLVGEETMRDSSDAFVFREVDFIRPKDGDARRSLYELVGRVGEIPEAGRRGLEDFANALALYRERAFSKALTLFEACSRDHEDPVAGLFERRCRRYLTHPPPSSWMGISDDRDVPAAAPESG